jgi:hypothetical protein
MMDLCTRKDQVSESKERRPSTRAHKRTSNRLHLGTSRIVRDSGCAREGSTGLRSTNSTSCAKRTAFGCKRTATGSGAHEQDVVSARLLGLSRPIAECEPRQADRLRRANAVMPTAETADVDGMRGSNYL